MFEFLKDLDNYEERKVDKTEPKDNSGIGVSTVYTSDEGYETALLDANGTHPVERYPNRYQAEEGHRKWVKLSTKRKKVKELGSFGGLVEDRWILLKDRIAQLERKSK